MLRCNPDSELPLSGPPAEIPSPSPDLPPPARQRFQIQLWELVSAPLLLGLPPALIRHCHPEMEWQKFAVHALLLNSPILLGLAVGYYFIHHDRITDPEKRSNAWTAGISLVFCVLGWLVCLPFAACMTFLVLSPSFESNVKGVVVWLFWFIVLLAWTPVIGGIVLLYELRKSWRR